MAEDWMGKPPAFVDPEEARKAAEILKRPAGVPRDPQELKDVPTMKAESLDSPPPRLDPEWTWFFPGLLYMIVGLEKSVFQLYSQWKGQDTPVKTYQAGEHIAKFNHPQVDVNPWLSIVQGIPVADGKPFREFVESFLFRRAQPVVAEYVVQAKKVRVADPFASGTSRVGTDMYFLLPKSMLASKEVVVIRGAGLTLDTPILNIKPMREETQDEK
jgi:hypothetical protein